MADFLARLEAADREALEAIARRRGWPRGTALFHEGDDPGAVYVISRGWVKVATRAPDGREVMLGLHGAGEVIGEMSALGSAPRTATVTAAEDVEALTVSGAAFRALVERRPAIALALVAVVAERLRVSDQRSIEFASLDVLGRVARRLSDLAEAMGRPAEDGVDIALPLTQEDLASWTGASREAVSRALATLRELGWIAVRQRRITVRDAARLAHAGGRADVTAGA